MRSIASCWCLILALMAEAVCAADHLSVTTNQLSVRLTPRTPQQMAAFYEARGFSRDMVNLLNQHCFITVSVGNKSTGVIWLDLMQWRFENADGVVIREDRSYWRERWAALQIPMAHQSTFRWTLLPEQLDFRPGEYEGGNIILPRLDKSMTITARFDTGEQRDGTLIQISFKNVACAEDT